ncbi:MAG: Sapep family Mn(2+)-dependent dipeptidase [Oscillospiraceae bacterium]|nr:Sapep family Mn(2+)-dependent dipeptidase [Oscillospiraceae bacterium]
MQTAKEFAESNRDNLLRDLKRLVDINSIKAEPEEGAPYGPGVKAAEEEAFRIAKELGFEKTVDCDGRIGYAHSGSEDRFLGVIGHLDVVPVGDGWDSDPFDMYEKEGYVMGRGTGDDKGPLLAAMYACKYLFDNKIPLRYGIRVLLGCDEECGMSDLEYYIENYPEPVFAFTPDAGFPVGHGEKGIYHADLVSTPIKDGKILSISGGMASNVVPDRCTFTVDGRYADALRAAAEGRDGYAFSEEDGKVTVTASGKAAHAGYPWGSVNANLQAVSLLLDSGILEGEEKKAAEFVSGVMSDVDGGFLGIAAEDGRFERNSIIGGMISITEDGRLCLNVNSRYNTAIPAEQIEKNISDKAAEFGFEVRNVGNSGPFYLEPDSPAVKLMCDIFNSVTGRDDKPFVMSGGTYARMMHNAVSFGCEIPGEEGPEWVGTAHMKNEGQSIDILVKSVEIYAQTLMKLQEVDF